MNYLPSKKFLTGATISLLLIGGLVFFFSNNTFKDRELSEGTLENNEGIIIFSRKKESLSPQMEKADDWIISNDSYTYLKNTENKITSSASNNETQKSFVLINLSQLNTTEETGLEGFQKYAKDLVSALKPYSFDGLPNEGFLTMNALETNNSEDLKKVAVMAELHKVVGETLIKIKVPNEIAPRHLSLINNILKISYLDLIMANAFNNPNDVMLAINRYKNETRDFVNSIADINDFFKTKDVTFNDGDKIKIYINSIE